MLLSAWLVAAAGCTDPVQRSSVTVLVDADSAVRGRITDVEVLVEAEQAEGNGFQARAMRRFMPNAPYRWPIQFRVPSSENDAGSTYQLTAKALNLENAVVAQARVISRLRSGENLTLRAHFEAGCFNLPAPCGPLLTCSGGKCVAADSDPYGKARSDEGGEKPAADGGESASEPDASAVSSQGDACPDEGARSCAGHGSRVPLLCENSQWRPEIECNENERCDTEAGPTQGMCRPIASECVNQTPEVPFCTADEIMLLCMDLVSSEVRQCGEHLRCVPNGKSARCGCKPGFIDQGNGCVEATSCDTGNGGCDPMTKCMPMNGTRVCGSCPPGFTGNGMMGCSPLLGSLVPSNGKLVPDFAPDVFDYQIQVPLMVQRLGLTAMAPGMAHLELNGTELAPGVVGLTPVLPLRTSMAEVVVSTDGGVPAAYRITIERTGIQEAYIKAAKPGTVDSFGYRLAAEGDTLVVGVPYEDSKAMGVNGDPDDDSLDDSGAAYVFVRKASGWVQQAYLKAGDPMSTSFFGVSVALSGDTLVVGCIEDDVYDPTVSPTRPGSAYVFTRRGETWTQQTKIVASGGKAGDWFGQSVAIDGDTLVVGASRGDTDVANSGTAHVFTRTGNVWAELPKLSAMMHTANAEFGSAVAISGDWIVVGAQEEDIAVSRSGGAYMFQRSGASWVARQRLTPPKPIEDGTFGVGLALRGDVLAVSAPRWEFAASLIKHSPGEVYIFERAQDQWAQTAVVRAAKPAPSDYFGVSVSLTDTALLVGANGEGSGGRGVGVDPQSGSAAYSGAAYLFARVGKDWTPSAFFKASNSESNDGFGYSVALSGDTAFASAVYERSNATGVDGDQTNNSVMNAGAVYAFH